MADYRPVLCSFWTDPDCEEWEPVEKLVYLFLCTNKETRESGIYQISPKYISERTCININKIKDILNTLSSVYNKITYDGNIIFVHGFMRRNFKGNPALLEKSIIRDVENSPSVVCWTRFCEIYKNHFICNKIKDIIKSFQSVIDTSMKMNMKIDMNLDIKREEVQEKGEPTWKDDFKIYEIQVSDAYDRLIADAAWMQERKKYHPNLDIRLSMEKAFNDFWGQEAGWKHKKKSHTENIDWDSTFKNALTLKANQVYEKRI